MEAAAVVELDFAADGDSAQAAAESAPRRGRKPRAASGGAAASRPATSARPSGAAAKELADVLAKVLGAISDVIALKIVEDAQAAMTAAEAQAIAEPAARLLLRSQLGKMLAKRIGTSSDAVNLALALAAYGLRVAPLLAAAERKHAHERAVKQSARQAGQAASNGAGPLAGDGAAAEFNPLPFAGGLALDLSAFQ